jgi:hypothetical protein
MTLLLQVQHGGRLHEMAVSVKFCLQVGDLNQHLLMILVTWHLNCDAIFGPVLQNLVNSHITSLEEHPAGAIGLAL